jgi:TonB family protein
MTRLQKKCLIATAGTHLLAIVLLFCSGFISSKPKADNVPLLLVIPENVVNEALNGGVKEAPKPKPPETNPPEKPPEPVHPEPPPPPKKIEPVEPPKPPEITHDDPTEPVTKPKPKPPTHQVIPNLDKKIIRADKPTVTKPPVKDTTAQDEARELAREKKRLLDAKLKAIANATSSISKNSSSHTEVSMPEGDGSVSFASYASVVKSIYEAKWQQPDDVANDQAVTKVSVTIARDGHVVESHIVTPSGDARMDASVRRTLERVKFIREFPDGAKEAQRIFLIDFELKTKRSFG